MTSYDLVIVGAGAAGLAAATYAQNHMLNMCVVYDALGGRAGRFLRHVSVPPTRLDYEPPTRLPTDTWIDIMFHQVSQTPEILLKDHVDRIEGTTSPFVVTTPNQQFTARAIVIATGVGEHPLAVAGAERFILHGLGYSMKPYAHLVDNKAIAVQGTSARTLRGIAELALRASHIYWLVPDPHVLETPLAGYICEHPVVEVLGDAFIDEIIGFHHIEELLVQQGGAHRRLSVDYLFVDQGIFPHSGAVCDLVDLDINGFIAIDQHGTTSVPGIFAAGDVTACSGEDAIVAIGDGTRAAISAYDFILASWLRDSVQS